MSRQRTAGEAARGELRYREARGTRGAGERRAAHDLGARESSRRRRVFRHITDGLPPHLVVGLGELPERHPRLQPTCDEVGSDSDIKGTLAARTKFADTFKKRVRRGP